MQWHILEKPAIARILSHEWPDSGLNSFLHRSCLFGRHWGHVLPHQCDTDALKFLWWPDSIEDQPEDFKILVHIFGAKSSPCCANKALNMTAQDNEDNYPQEVVETVRRNFCVTRLSSLEPHQPCNCSTLLIHSVDEIGAIYCSFVMGKAHNAPIREWTIST